MMKVAFLMQCHKNPKQINLLLKALKHPQVDVFIHVDSKNENIRETLRRSMAFSAFIPNEKTA